MTDVYSPYLTYTIWSEWLLLSFLVFAGIIYWTISKRIGFQALYLTVFSLSLGFIITLYFPFLYTENELLPLTHPHVQASMTLFSFFIPLSRRRIDIILYLLAPLLVSISYMLIEGIPVFPIVGGILIGGFISYMYYRSLDWIGAMPETYLFAFAMILPLFIIGLIYPKVELLILPGILLGAGIGVTLEQFKLRMKIESSSKTAKFIAILLGSAGMIMLFLIIAIYQMIPFANDLAIGILAGLWITLIVPAILLITHLYDFDGKNRQVF